MYRPNNPKKKKKSSKLFHALKKPYIFFSIGISFGTCIAMNKMFFFSIFFHLFSFSLSGNLRSNNLCERNLFFTGLHKSWLVQIVIWHCIISCYRRLISQHSQWIEHTLHPSPEEQSLLLAALLATTKFNGNHESAFLVAASLQVGWSTPVVALEVKTLSRAAWRLTLRHCTCSHWPYTPSSSDSENQQHTSIFLYPSETHMPFESNSGKWWALWLLLKTLSQYT